MPKFMQSLDNKVYEDLERLAKKRGISVQTLIRAVIVPEWASTSATNIASDSENGHHHKSESDDPISNRPYQTPPPSRTFHTHGIPAPVHRPVRTRPEHRP